MKIVQRLVVIAALCGLTACAIIPAPHTQRPVSTREGDYLVGRYAALNDDPAEAARRFGRLISAAPSPFAIPERAVYYALSSGHFARAESHALTAYAAGARAPVILLTLGTGELQRGRNRAAVQHFRALQTEEIWRPLATDLIAWSRVKESVNGTTSAPAGALILFSQREDAAALQAFETLHASPLRLAPSVKAHAELLSAAGDPAAARALIAKATAPGTINSELAALDRKLASGGRLKPERYSAREGAALMLFLAGADRASARVANEPLLTLSLALDPARQDARYLLAEAVQREGRAEDARALFAAIPKRSPHYAAARRAIAQSLLRDGLEAEALKTAAQSLAAFPDAALKRDLAELHIELEQYARADALLTELIDAAEPGAQDWRTYFSRGAARERLGTWTLARADLDRALKLQPGHPMILNYLGYAQADRGENLDGALAMIEEAVRKVPGSAAYADSLGWAHYKLGAYEDATTHLERAVSLDPSDPVLNDHLGDAYWKTGRAIEARFQWQKALKTEKDEALRATLVSKIATGLPAGLAALTPER